MPDPAHVALVEAGAAQDRGVLVVRGGVLGADAEEEEGLHAWTATPRSMSPSTSATPQAVSASRVWVPAAGDGGSDSVAPVRENRGAGCGCISPSCSTKVCRALRCGCSGASLTGITPATQASVPSNSSTHSAWVFCLNVSVSRVAQLVVPVQVGLPGRGVLEAEHADQRGVELRLQGADRQVLAVRGLVDVVEGHPAVEEVGAALVPGSRRWRGTPRSSR